MLRNFVLSYQTKSVKCLNNTHCASFSRKKRNRTTN